MSLPIYVDAYSGFKANERPRQFVLDEDTFEIAAVEQQWRSPDGEYFKVRATDGKHYVLRHNETKDQWTLQSDFDGAKLRSRSSLELVTVEPNESLDPNDYPRRSAGVLSRLLELATPGAT